MKNKCIALSMCVILAACGGGGHSSNADATVAPEKSAYEIWLAQGNVGTEQDFIAYQTWLANGNIGSYQDYLIIKAPTKPMNSVQANSFADMSFNTLGSRDHAEYPVKIQTNDAGEITGVELVDLHDPSGWRYHEVSGDEFGYQIEPDRTYGTVYNFKPHGDKLQSQTIYYYDLPVKCDDCMVGFTGVGFRTDKELSLAEIKENFRQALASYQFDNETKEKITASIDALTEADRQTTPVCYDVNCRYTDSDLGHYFVSPQSLTMSIDAFGRDVGLEYSNFGEIRGSYNLSTGSLPRSYVFAGGQEANIINKDALTDTMSFSGKAVGQVLYHYSDLTDTQQSYMDVAGNAVLRFDNGTEELAMNFSDNKDSEKRWYDVKLTSDINSNEKQLTLSNGDKIADQNAKYKFAGVSDNSFSTTLSPENPERIVSAEIGTEYYGAGDTPTEVVGKVIVHQQTWSDDLDAMDNKEVTFFGAFGAVKDK